jgi:hypothetical protein
MQDNNQEFSTFDVVRIIGIDRSRLVHWMRGEFIPLGKDKPWGKGYKTAFSLFNLYSIALFRECVDFSLSREVAKRCWLYVDWAQVIKEKLWLMAVTKEFEKFIRDREIRIKTAMPGTVRLETSEKTAQRKSGRNDLVSVSYPVLEAKPRPKDKDNLPFRKKAEKEPSLPKPFKLQTGETIVFKKNFQSLKKSEFSKGGGIMIVVDLKSIVDNVNIMA